MPNPVRAEMKTEPAMAETGHRPVARRGIEQVRLVEGDQARLGPGAQLVEHGLHGLAVLVEMGIGRVDHLDEEIGLGGLLEGGLEGLDEMVRQVATKPTVSVRRREPPLARVMRLVVGSRVAKSLSSARTAAAARELRRLDLPAFV